MVQAVAIATAPVAMAPPKAVVLVGGPVVSPAN
ncbi:hypothetical protein HNP98_000942 [Hymenobacter sp. 9A]|uniref:Uncharacterized protein n=1 Tax=Hymenobacter caeli TaxID=2735894 RepID=A0ABX2FM91_9BACT|nr:hypothetical protein [Hymenobacter caeli]